MRNQNEIDLAILSLQKDLETTPRYNFFGDDTHEMINLGLDILRDGLTQADLYQMEDDYEITPEQSADASAYLDFMSGDIELDDIMYDPANIVTEL